MTGTEASIVLRDGSTVVVRPVEPSDEHGSLPSSRASLSSRVLRFFGASVNLRGAARWAADVAPADVAALEDVILRVSRRSG